MLDDIIARYIKEKRLDKIEIEKARNISLQKNINLVDAIIELKPEIKNDFLMDLAEELNLIYIDVNYFQFPPEIIYLLDEDLIRRNCCLPLFKVRNWLFLLLPYPPDHLLLEQVQRITACSIKPCLGLRKDIQSAIDKLFRKPDSAEKIISQIGDIRTDLGSSISKLVGLLIAQAVRDRASDIHIEPEENLLRIRFRIDGILQEVPSPPKELEPAIISRVKVMASLDIAESRLPQDGHFTINVDGKDIDVRVSTLPTVNGENVVMRILDTSNVLLGLEKLGFSAQSLKRFRDAISRPYGIILTTGPTGSGKTTTLYSALMELNSLDRHIVTIEDPVEYRLPLIRQVQINPKAGLSFASGLRSILRHDPDIIMVGEIRDLETAVIAVQAALTGHLVFSTLHTNDAISTITRLENMGIEPFLISASLICAMAQRLVRKICPACKKPYEVPSAVIERLGLSDKKLLFYRGEGCDNCKGTGYQGRTGIFEILLIDDELREMITQSVPLIEIQQKARAKGMKLLFEDGLDKVLKGITTIEEVSRVCEEKVELPKKRELFEVKPFRPQIDEKIPVSSQVDREKLENYTKKFLDWIGKRRKSNV